MCPACLYILYNHIFACMLLLGCPCPHAVQDKSAQGCLMHSSHFLGITPCSWPDWAHTPSVVFQQRWHASWGHNAAHYSLWRVPVWSSWPCLLSWLCFDVRSSIGGEICFCCFSSGGRPHLLSPPPPSLFPLHSWSSSLLSCNCSSVLGNRGRKSLSFRCATMTI